MDSFDGDRSEAVVGALRRKNRLLVVVVALLVVVIVLAVCVLVEENKRTIEEIAVTPAVSESAAFYTSTPAPAVTQLSDEASNRVIIDILARLDDVSGYMSAYNEMMWMPDDVALYDTDIIEYEKIWAGYRDEMAGILAEMDINEPSALFATSWNDLYDFVSKVHDMALTLSDWDLNGDGECTGKECSLVNNRALDQAVEAKDSITQMDNDYGKAVELWAAKQTTPGPTATPYRSTSRTGTYSRSYDYDDDPYDAWEYSDPEDFYYDHYDDFFDYEDAEDYWYDTYD